MHNKLAYRAVLLAGILFLQGCQIFTTRIQSSPQERSSLALGIGEKGRLSPHVISTPEFRLLAYIPNSVGSDTLRIYIEGDGSAWQNSQTPSTDPTPSNPVALRLAVADINHSSVYLARPCQYQIDASPSPPESCSQKIWTSERFSNSVVTSLNFAIDQLKGQFHAKNIILIGYSGGGALAILCAARRSDVKKIVTIAGNVSIREWVKTMGLQDLTGSLDPLDFAQAVKEIPQWHFVGSDDEIVRPSLIKSFVSHAPITSPIQVINVKGFGHQCCWERDWPLLLKQFD